MVNIVTLRKVYPPRKAADLEATLPGTAPFGAAMLSEAAWRELARSLKLSGREMQITRGAFDNLTEGAIAAKLRISEHTIHEHFHRLFRKLGVTTRSQMILRVMHQFLVLTVSDSGCLPPLCRNWTNGRCEVKE